MRNYEAVVIGAGPGGYEAAHTAYAEAKIALQNKYQDRNNSRFNGLFKIDNII